MHPLASWLALVLLTFTACDGDKGGDSGESDADTDADADTDTDTDTDVTKGDRWDGEYTGGWSLTFDKKGSIEDAGTCTGGAVVTVDGKTIEVELTTSPCKGVGLTFYGKKPTATVTGGDVVLDPGFPSNSGTADFEIVGTKETCAFEFDWTFSDIENHPTQVVAEYQLRSEEQFKDEYCAGAGYWFEFQAEIPKKED